MKKLIPAAAIGLAGLLGCKDVRTEYSEPIPTEVNITQKYVAARSETVYGPVFDPIEGNIEFKLHTEHYPAEHSTTIQSKGCTQTFNNQRVYEQFQANKPQTMHYVDAYRNTYGQRPNAAEKEIILLESKKTGCKFLGVE